MIKFVLSQQHSNCICQIVTVWKVYGISIWNRFFILSHTQINRLCFVLKYSEFYKRRQTNIGDIIVWNINGIVYWDYQPFTIIPNTFYWNKLWEFKLFLKAMQKYFNLLFITFFFYTWQLFGIIWICSLNDQLY